MSKFSIFRRTSSSSLSLLVGLILVLAAFGSSRVSAQSTLLVPGQFATIQGAINAAASGDRILVSQGTYAEAIDYGNKELDIRSADGAGVTIIDGQLAATVVTIAGLQADSRLEGFSIRNGQGGPGAPGGLSIRNAAPVIVGCRIHDNRGGDGDSLFGPFLIARGGGPGAVEVRDASPLFEDCAFENNVGGRGGDGLLPTALPNPQGGPGGAGGVSIAATLFVGIVTRNTTFVRCSFVDNCGGDGGDVPVGAGGLAGRGGDGGIFNNNALVTMKNCLAARNQGGDGGDATELTAFDGRAGSGFYFGLIVDGSDFFHVTVTENMHGSGVLDDEVSAAFVLGRPATFTNCIVWGNPSTVNQPIAFPATISPIVRFCDIEGGFPGAGNIDVDPSFVAPVTGDYRLQDGSPAEDAADASAVTLPDFDVTGGPRWVEVGPDMGAFETNRRLGSGEDLQLHTRVNLTGDATFPTKIADVGDLLEVSFETAGGTFAGAVPALFAHLFPSSTRLHSPLAFPELEVNIAALILFDGLAFGPAVFGPGAYTFLFTLPPIAGETVRFQAVALTSAAANGIFAGTPSHDVIVR